MLDWIREHQEIVWMAGGSVVVGATGMLAACIAIVMLPADYFQQEQGSKNKSGGNPAWRIGRNILGWLLIVGGVAMLILPGPGLVIVLLGIMLADFPGKSRVQRWILSRGSVLKSANWLRRKFGKPPLKAKVKGGAAGGKKGA